MREIKFRCWNEREDYFIHSDDKWEHDHPQDGDGWFAFENGKLTAWISETIAPSDHLEAPYPSSYKLESPIEAFIGLKDCKRTEEYPEGQEIYEGDICKETHEHITDKGPSEDGWQPNTLTINFRDGMFAFGYHSNDLNYFIVNWGLKIIGNIHQEEKP